MGRGPSTVYIPYGSWNAASEVVRQHIRRLYVEANAYLTCVWQHQGSVTAGSAVTAYLPAPMRSRTFLRLGGSFNGVGAGTNQALFRLYKTSIATGNRAFELDLSITGSGVVVGSTTSVVNDTKQYVSTGDQWIMRVDVQQGTIDTITIEAVYEEFVGHVR